MFSYQNYLIHTSKLVLIQTSILSLGRCLVMFHSWPQKEGAKLFKLYISRFYIFFFLKLQFSLSKAWEKCRSPNWDYLQSECAIWLLWCSVGSQIQSELQHMPLLQSFLLYRTFKHYIYTLKTNSGLLQSQIYKLFIYIFVYKIYIKNV